MARAALVVSLVVGAFWALVGCGDEPVVPTPTPIAPTATATVMPTPSASPTPESGVRLALEVARLDGGGLPESGDVEKALELMEERARELDLNFSGVTQGDSRLAVELRGRVVEESDIAAVTRQGLLEIVDGGNDPLTEGYVITTTLGPPTSQAGAPVLPEREYTTIITGDQLLRDKVDVVFDPATNQSHVSFSLDTAGASELAKFTEKNVGKYMPIVLDKQVISAPIIQSAILGGNGVIVGLSMAEARELKAVLASGTLPVKLTLLSVEQLR